MKYVLVLCSGGIDSTACIHYYQQLGFLVEGLFVGYGQKALKKELEAIKKISKYYNISTKNVSIETNYQIEEGMILGRNLMLLSTALVNYPRYRGLIALGIHTGTNYSDCKEEFILKTQSIIDMYCSGKILIDCPFIKMSKREIFHYCKLNNVPLDLTYSCENGSPTNCGVCQSCKDLRKLYEFEN